VINFLWSENTFAQLNSDESYLHYPKAFIGLNVGLSFPVAPEEFTNNYKTGICYGAELTFPLDESYIQLGAGFNICNYNFDPIGAKEYFRSEFGYQSINKISGPNASLWNIAAICKLFGDEQPFFIGIGIGYFKLNRGKVSISGIDFIGTSTTTSEELISKGGVYMNLNGGLIFKLSNNLEFIIESDFSLAKSEDDESTGYIIHYSTGGSEVERKSTMYLELKTGLRISL
jgi:hypothetical protein